MSRTIEVLPGDDFESLARRSYGVAEKSTLIRNANPGVFEPLVAGTIVTVPPDTSDLTAGRVFNFSPTDDENQVTMRVDGRQFTAFETITFFRHLDGIDEMSFSCPFESDDPDFRSTFQPFTYKDVEVLIGNELVFTGTIVDITPQVSSTRKSLSIGCYSLPGVMVDSQIPSSTYPIEWFNATLREIAPSVCSPFGIGVVFANDVGAPFDPDVSCGISRKAFTFLSDLALQRNLIITNDEEGRIVFFSPDFEAESVANLEQGRSPLMSVSPTFDGQQYFSSISGIDPASFAFIETAPFTIQNPFLKGNIRPYTFEVPDSNGATLEQAVSSKAGRMFGALASYTVQVPNWRDKNSALWRPNTFVNLLAPDAMIYKSYKFLVRSVRLIKNATEFSAELDLVMPGSFSGQIPDSLPWIE